MVVGDVLIDSVCQLPPSSSETLGLPSPIDVNAFTPISVLPGGDAVHAAVAARAAGFQPVRVVARVGGQATRDGIGPDADAARVESWLASEGVEACWSLDPDRSTGRALVVYRANGRRLMIADPGASERFSASDVTDEMRDVASAAAVVHVSGYYLLNEDRWAAARTLLDGVRRHGGIAALDLAPHDICRRMGRGTLASRLAGAFDWLVMECGTGVDLLGLRAATDEASVAERVLDGLTAYSPSVIVYPHPGQAWVMHEGRRWMRRFEYSPGTRSRGHSARTQWRILSDCMA